jgi:hypothetical protein
MCRFRRPSPGDSNSNHRWLQHPLLRAINTRCNLPRLGSLLLQAVSAMYDIFRSPLLPLRCGRGSPATCSHLPALDKLLCWCALGATIHEMVNPSPSLKQGDSISRNHLIARFELDVLSTLCSVSTRFCQACRRAQHASCESACNQITFRTQ